MTRQTSLLRRSMAVLAVLASSFLIGSAPASAHMGVAVSNPSNGSQIKVAPKDAMITFSTAVELDSAAARLRYIGGVDTPITEIANKDVRTESLTKLYGSGQGTDVTFDLPDLPNGLYAIDWAVDEIGGHANNSTILFKVTDAPGASLVPLIALVIALTILVAFSGALIARRKK
jgi:methionine-rich copper-binding protein CopC